MGTATGANGQTVTCSAPVTVQPQTNQPACTLVANKTQITPGEQVTLTWTTQNVTSATINPTVGNLSPVSGGTATVSPTSNTTYTLTGQGTNGQTVNCPVTITVTTNPVGPTCFLNVTPESIDEGEEVTISWGGTNISTVSIDQGIGSVPTSGTRTDRPNDDKTYTGTFVGTNGQTITCSDSVNVDDDDGGGGGGGGSRKPKVLLDVLPSPEEEPPLSFVYLSEMPYTGLDLGPVGTALYWLMLIGWSLAAAYLLLFTIMPFAYRRITTFGSDVKYIVNQTSHAGGHGGSHDDHGDAHHGAGHAAPAAHAAPAHHAPVAHAAPAASPASYTAHEGFRSYAQGPSLTIDDIVKGLSRETEHAAAYTEPVIVPHTDRIEMPAPAPVRHEAPAAPAVEMHHDIPAFLGALLAGDRDTVFAMLRDVNRSGGDSETFVTHAVCALDDAYRARLDGTRCHPEVARVTERCATPFLERVIASLATAVDASYSTSVTGAKLALTRALAVVNG